jgi:hypothetical protein
LSSLRGIRPAIPGPTGGADESVPAHVEVDALKTVLARHVTGADGMCCCGEPAGEFTGRCATGRRAAVRLAALGFTGYDVS